MNYTSLSLPEIIAGLDDVARDAQTTFGALDDRHLNWKPDATRWSVGQCFDHLVTANNLMLQSARASLDPSQSRSVWQRMPGLPRMYGWIMIRSLEPAAKRKLPAPSTARPGASDIAPDIVSRFVEQHRDAVRWMRTLDEQRAARAIMTSPFAGLIVYSVLDACRILLTHNRRHVEQARRVTLLPEYLASN